ncbi:MAG: T9SS type A sorting domain-containing protein [Saprospiraceae bacterium]|nr:T9SS type A sorting domain-containing protein [Saprospiraceae bacterium]
MKKAFLLTLFYVLNVALIAQPSVDGDMGDSDYITLGSFSSGRNSFGDDNDLGVIKFYTDNTDIYIGITGETTSNDNIVLFFNFSGYTGRGAGNELDPINNFEGFVGVFNKSANSGLDAAKMDFDVDYALAFNEGETTTNYFIDAARYGEDDMLSNAAIGSTGNQTGTAATLDLGSTFGGTGNILIAYDNSFASDSDKGVEMRIPLAVFAGVNNTQTLELFAIITSNTGFMSNETIPGDPGASNLGNDANLFSISGQDFFTSSQSLPVELSSFSGIVKGENIELNWETTAEINNSHFVIERASTEMIFQKIGEISGKGNSTTLQQYQFVDRFPLSGNNYYRLRQVDFDGAHEFSEVLHLDRLTTAATKWRCYPNPVKDRLYIRMTQPVEGAMLRLLNSQGQVLLRSSVASVLDDGLPVSHLPKGIYHVQVVDEDGKTVFSESINHQ